MRRSNGRRGAGTWVTVHAPDLTKPARDSWLAQPTACGVLRMETLATVERFVTLADGSNRSHKCQKCVTKVTSTS